MEYSGFIQKVFQKLGKLDIDKIKEIMVELSTEKELYKLVFDSMIEGVIVTNKDNKVILINRVMEGFISVSKNRVNFQELGSCNFDPEIEEFLNDFTVEFDSIEIHVDHTHLIFLVRTV